MKTIEDVEHGSDQVKDNAHRHCNESVQEDGAPALAQILGGEITLQISLVCGQSGEHHRSPADQHRPDRGELVRVQREVQESEFPGVRADLISRMNTTRNSGK